MNTNILKLLINLVNQKGINKFKPFLLLVLRYIRISKRNYINFIKVFKIKLSQEILLRNNYPSNTEKLIIFLTPGFDVANGGIISISSIYEESIKFKHIHRAEVIMCTIPGDPLLLKYTKFNNQNYIYRFSQVLSYFKNLQNLMIHIPEYCIEQFLKNIPQNLFKIKDLHLNIMLQNIKLLSPIEYVERLKLLGRVTCTTAHEQYSTIEIRRKLGFPLHKLHWFLSHEQYNKKRYVEKEDLMVVSPDYHPKKSEVLSLISTQFPNLKIKIINNLTYEEYKNIISRAKWAITFGEGLDGYFVETIFSGGVSFSAYNPIFFTEDFKSLQTIYNDYDVLLKKICSDIKELDDEDTYVKYQREQFDLCYKYFNYKQYIDNLKLFYNREYTYK